MIRKSISVVLLLMVLLPFSAAAIGSGATFGHRQVEQVLDDRPDLKTILVPGSEIYDWITNAFDGKYFGQRIYWNASEPSNDALSSCSSPIGSYPAHIQVTSSKGITPFDRLALLIFELHNIENANEFIELAKTAKSRQISREQYVEKMIELELKAHSKVVMFFDSNPVPDGIGREYKWMTSPTPSLENYKASFARERERGEHTRSNFETFGKAWDKLVKRP